MNKKLIVFFIIALLLSFYLGFNLGVAVTIKSVADIAIRFVDRSLVEQAIFQYKNNIGACFPILNNGTYFFNDEGN